MSLRLRLALGVALIVGLTLVLAGALTGRAVLHPFAREVFHGFLDQAVWVADALAEGEDPAALSEPLGLRLVVLREAPTAAEHPDWVLRHHRHHAVAFHPRRRDRVAVHTAAGWVLVERELDLERPARRGALFFAAVAGVVVLCGVWVSGAAVRPLRAAQGAMARMAEGDLQHRLPERGPSELAEAARAFNRMADRVDGILRREKELMASISHELRTPLTRVRLELELLRDAGAPESRLDAVSGDLDEMEALLSELLELSRLDLGQVPLRLEPVDLRVLVGELLERLELGEHPVAVEGVSGEVQADPRLLERALSNLVRNAVRYTPPGTPVWVRVSPRGVVVEDAGPGVPDAALQRLFDPFFRVEGSRSRDTGGLGLGLMIVQRVAALHGGGVRASNRPEGGLRVELDLRAPTPPSRSAERLPGSAQG